MIWSCGKIRDGQLWAQAPPAQGVVEPLGFSLDTEKVHITSPTTHSQEPGIISHWCGQLARSNLLMNRARKDVNARRTVPRSEEARSTLK